METGSSSNLGGNVQTLRNMWSLKAKEQDKPLQPTSIPSRPHSAQQQQKTKSPKDNTPALKIMKDTTTTATTKKQSPITPSNEKTTTFQSVEKLPRIEENISVPLPPPPPAIIFHHQAKTVATLKKTLNKMASNEKKDIFSKAPRNNGIHRWNITRHVFRSGLIFNRTRRASDSILPLLMKTHEANHRSRTDSIDSTFDSTPFDSLVDYLTYNKEGKKDSLTVPQKMKRTRSDTSDCMRRNKLDDSIFQYEMILRHLKNYNQFMSTYPASSLSFSSISSKQQEKSFDSGSINSTNEANEKFLARSSIPNRKTQSLSRNVGRTFSEFIMNDLYLTPLSKKSSNEQRCLNISHASSQTDIIEPIHDITDQTNTVSEIIPPTQLNKNNLISNEQAKAVLTELDTILENSDQELLITSNNNTNIVVLNPPDLSTEEAKPLPKEKPLMQRLFEGNKTAYSSDDLNMQTLRLPIEMMPTYEIAKKKCFFDTETLIYTTKMIKISRRGYTQHLRLLCITNERLYNITKKNPYPKEALSFNAIMGITCTPYKDGFMCIHTREVHEDRGDWLVVVDHPCEFITQLFMVMGRNNNDDHFLKFESKFTHIRRSCVEGCSSDCSVEVHLSDSFSVEKADFDVVAIFTP